MDYYAKKRDARLAEIKRAERLELAKQILTVVVTLPVLWVIAVLFLSI
jgi:hypothetical protein